MIQLPFIRRKNLAQEFARIRNDERKKCEREKRFALKNLAREMRESHDIELADRDGEIQSMHRQLQDVKKERTELTRVHNRQVARAKYNKRVSTDLAIAAENCLARFADGVGPLLELRNQALYGLDELEKEDKKKAAQEVGPVPAPKKEIRDQVRREIDLERGNA